MKIFGHDHVTVAASATAIRRDVNIMLVLDRSNSMDQSGSCDDLRAAAAGFVSRFAPGRDNVGLVTFATSSVIEFPMGNNFATANPTLEQRINSISCDTGFTSSADGLSLGYWELARLNEPSSLNAIVFFTDGQPTALHASFPLVGNNPPPAAGVSPCPVAAPPAGQQRVLAGVLSAYEGLMFGLMRPRSTTLPVTNDYVPAPGSGPATINGIPNQKCTFLASGNAPFYNYYNTNQSDYRYVPDTDIWGNRLANGYQTPISRSNVPAGPGTGQPALTGANNKISKTFANVQRAAVNAADDAALRIRTGAVMNGRTLPGVVIFGIGLGNAAAPASHDLMLRVTNDPSSPIYVADAQVQREGLYVFAPTAADLNDAFTRLASEILRISH
jgi:hypothetical protein